MVTFDYKVGRRQGQIRCDETILKMIRNHFSVKNDAKSHVRDPNKRRFIADRKYALTPTGLFDFGMYYEIRKFLINEQITEIEFTEDFKKRLKCGLDCQFENNLKYDERYFQKDSVDKGLKIGSGIFLIATGGGKSFCQALLVENFKKAKGGKFKCLIIVPGLSLVSQLNGDFSDYNVGITYSGWTGDMELQDTEIVICNAANLLAKFDTNPWIVDVDLLIVDECHGINDDANISKIVSKIKTPNRFGFTGTLPEKPLDKWKVIGTFGPVVYEKKSKELRDEKYLSDVEIIRIQLNHGRTPKMPYRAELSYLYSCEERNDIICKLVSKMKNNSLIMVNHLEQMENIYNKMKKLDGFQVYSISGETPVEERERIRALMEVHDDVIVVAMSSIFSTGINIKNLHNIFLVALGKAFIRLVQSIGRGLRLHDSKNKLRIYDIYDNMKYSDSHAEERRRIYEEQEIRIIDREILL